MANEDLRVRIAAQVAGLDQVDSLRNAVRQLQNVARPTSADLDKLKNAAMQLGSASDRTEDELRKSINALKDVRAQLSMTDREYKNLTNTINKYQGQLNKATGAQQRGGRAQQFGQNVGAIAAGGVFGGPEGFLGGAIGAFTPIGALGGAALGAQVGMMRQSLGAMASFTAEIDKQRIALRNVVGDQEAYNSSLRFIDATSRRLAIPQDQLNKQFTQLSASVIGAGGNVDAAKVAFAGIAAGIRGTGGSLQDLQGALLATSQVFGKGKVSAEELRQQIGERMPGAFTIFAESIGKTPQELDKMLSRGEVTLNDFMKFAQELSSRYGQSANEIAASSQSAGDRMQVTFARIREAVGRELQPVGAQFQKLIARVLAENEQQIIQFAKGIADAARAIAGFLTSAGPAIFEIAKLAVQFAAASLAIKVFTALQGPIQTMFLALQNGFTATTAQAAAAQTRMIAFGTTAKAIAASLAAPIIVTIAIVGAGIVIKTLNDIKAARDRLAQQATLPRGEQFIQSIGGSAASYETLVRNANDVAKALDIEERNLKTLRERSAQRQTSTYSGLNQENKTLKTQIDATEKSITRLKINYRALIDAIPGAQKTSQAGLDFSFPGGDVAGGGAGGGKAAKGPEDITAAELSYRRQLIDAREAENKLVEAAIQLELDLLEAAKMKGTPLKQQLAIEEANARYRKAEKDAAEEIGRDVAKDFINRINKAEEFKEVLEDLKIKTGEIKGQELKQLEINREIEAILKRFPDLTQAQIDKVKELVTASKDVSKSFGESFKEKVKGYVDSVKDLGAALGDIAVGSLQKLEDTLLEFVTTGKLRFREFVASVLSDLAKLAIRLAIVNTIKAIFPGAGFATGGAFQNGKLLANANGNAFAANGIVPYAKGGIVNSPTLFKFAKGGSMATGVMGEAGPEAIMPLKRGPDGKLGVQATGGGGIMVNVNVDAKGTSVEGDQGQGQQLGRIIAIAVQSELIKQQRPGGVLNKR